MSSIDSKSRLREKLAAAGLGGNDQPGYGVATDDEIAERVLTIVADWLRDEAVELFAAAERLNSRAPGVATAFRHKAFALEQRAVAIESQEDRDDY